MHYLRRERHGGDDARALQVLQAARAVAPAVTHRRLAAAIYLEQATPGCPGRHDGRPYCHTPGYRLRRRRWPAASGMYIIRAAECFR